MLAVTTMEQAREKIKALGFSDQDRGTLVAILLALPPADRFLVFEDVDAVVTASLQAMLRQNNPPQPQQQPPQPPQLQQQQQQQFQQLQPPLIPIPQQQQQQQQPPQGFFNTIGNMFGFSNAAPPMHQSFVPQQQQRGIMPNRPPVNQFSDVVFDDDQAPIEQPPAYEAVQSVQTAETTLSLKTKTLVPAVEFGSATQTLSMITIKSPALASDAPRASVALDLVAVLDISGSMSGSKIELMKQAVQFVIRELTDKDRLCLIVFHSTGEKLCPLTVMNEEGKNKLLFIVDRITSRGSTMIGDGLRLAIQTLQKRRYPNNVPSILLLSDGQDDRPDEVRALEIPFVTHTFGFGADHDAALLGLIAQKTHGSFTFVEKFDLIAESFATCVGGLTSIFAQKINLKVEMQGPYQFLKWHTRFAAEIAPDKKSATLSITDIYSEESRDIIFEIDVPKLPAPIEADKLFSVGCTYVKVAQNPENVTLPLVHQNLARPQALPAGMTRDFELDKQWNRIMTASAMENAPKLCQDGKFNEAQDVIKKTIASIEQSVSGNDPTCKALVEDLKTCASRLVDRTTYETSGKAFAMQQQQSHWGQRATYSPMAAPNAYSNVQSSQWAEKAKVSKKGF